MQEEMESPEEEKEVAPTGESKADKFKRLATKRVNRANKYIDLIGNLSTSQYEYTEEQVDQIIHDLSDHVNGVRERFSKRLNRDKGFSL